MNPKNSRRSAEPKEKTYETAMEKALTLLEYRSRTCDQMRRQLADRGYSENVTEQVIDRLVELRLLDDETYAARYIDARTRKGYGPRRSRYELRQRGISEEVLSGLDDAVSEEEELEAALPVAKKVRKKNEGQEKNKVRSKVYTALMQRGFDYEIIDRVWRILTEETEEETE